MKVLFWIFITVLVLLLLIIVIDAGIWLYHNHFDSRPAVKDQGSFLALPDDFLWGANIGSAHQVEGNNVNDFSRAEMERAEFLAKTAPERLGNLSMWPDVEIESRNPKVYISGRATDFYHLYNEDFDLAADLGLNVVRVSCEWSRIEPREGVFDESEIDHYREVIRAAKARHLKVMFNLWHFTIPLWLEEKGGWENPEAVEYFTRYVAKVAEAFKAEGVDFWLTMNEPECYASFYKTGVGPIPKKGSLATYRVLINLVEAHKRSYRAIKKEIPEALVSLTTAQVYFEAYQGKIVNRVLRFFAEHSWNFYFLDKTRGFYDFIGLNYYVHCRIDYGFWKNDNKIVSDGNWELYPEGIYHVTKRVHERYGMTIYVTEHGLADRHDRYRAWYIKETLRYIHQALGEGIDVRGYLYWSLTDNFEWDGYGYLAKFGLIEINFETLERRVRPSALEYKKIIHDRGLELTSPVD